MRQINIKKMIVAALLSAVLLAGTSLQITSVVHAENITSSEQTADSVALVGDTYYTDIQKAINASSETNPCILVKDVTYDTLDIRDINTVLKTNGYTLTLSSNIRMNGTAVFKIIGNGREGKVALKAAEIYQNSTSNKLYLEDVNFEQSNSAFYSMLSGWGYIHIKNSRIVRAETDKNAFSVSTYTTALLKELLNLREMLF